MKPAAIESAPKASKTATAKASKATAAKSAESATAESTHATAAETTATAVTTTLSHCRYRQQATQEEELRNSSHHTYLQSQPNAARGG